MVPWRNEDQTIVHGFSGKLKELKKRLYVAQQPQIYKLPVPGSAATTRDGVAGVVEWGWIEKQSQCCSNARELTGSARRRKRGEART